MADAPGLSPQEAANLPPTVQRLVRLHPGSGRKSLYLGSHAESIVGWPADESRSLLDELEAQITRPEFVYCHVWQNGDLVMWDNRCTLHRATPFREDLYARDMRRTTVADA
jgi:alpha-ketoglutarate-dependent 2,4-dichlorophenoxyacetate dioxygenase